MDGIQAIVVDEREPEWVAEGFGEGAQVALLPAGDVMVAATDDEVLLIERKEPDDLLASIADGRLFHQVGAMVEQTRWSYVVITGALIPDSEGCVNGTRWRYSSVQGALLTVQEAGGLIAFCDGRRDFVPCVQRLAKRNRGTLRQHLRRSAALSNAENVLAAFPGIGPERAVTLLKALPPAYALEFLTDVNWRADTINGIGDGIKSKVRRTLDLADNLKLAIVPVESNGGRNE